MYVFYSTFATQRECLEIFKPSSRLMVEGMVDSLMIDILVVDSGLILIDRGIVVHGLMLEGASVLDERNWEPPSGCDGLVDGFRSVDLERWPTVLVRDTC